MIKPVGLIAKENLALFLGRSFLHPAALTSLHSEKFEMDKCPWPMVSEIDIVSPCVLVSLITY